MELTGTRLDRTGRNGGRISRTVAIGVLLAAGALFVAAPAEAAIPASLHDPANCVQLHAIGGSVYRCNDGVPAAGGRTPNPGADLAVAVPAAYGGDGYSGLPALEPSAAAAMPGADGSGMVALDVDVALPIIEPPPAGYPLVLIAHGCCYSDKTHGQRNRLHAPQSWRTGDSWYAARGALTVTWTARGFVDEDGFGSTGEAHLNSRRFEINDLQHLACQVIAAAPEFSDVTGLPVSVDPSKVVVVGGSGGGAVAWLTATDPDWSCEPATGPSGPGISLAAAMPFFGWTDLAYAFFPTGSHSFDPADLPAVNGCDSAQTSITGAPCPAGSTAGIPKRSWLETFDLPDLGGAVLVPEYLQLLKCSLRRQPRAGACRSLASRVLPEWMRDSSPYYQNGFFARLAIGARRVPIFSQGAATDTLVGLIEHRRMINRLLSVAPDYPITHIEDDVLHLTQFKPKVYPDLCGEDRHVCIEDDFPDDLLGPPANRARKGIATRAVEFFDDRIHPPGNPTPAPDRGGYAARVQVCPQTEASLGFSVDESGPEIIADDIAGLAPGELELDFGGPARSTTSRPGDDAEHALAADPFHNAEFNLRSCVVERDEVGPGQASYTSDPFVSVATIVGGGTVNVELATPGPRISGSQIHARVYDLFPDGRAVLVDRGLLSLDGATTGPDGLFIEIPLIGNSWRFDPGHRVRVELTQDSEPYLAASDDPTGMLIRRVGVRSGLREGGLALGGEIDLFKGRCSNPQVGFPGPQRLDGSWRGDDLEGLGGPDRLQGRRGADCLQGGGGDDIIGGGPGRDRLEGGTGMDRIKARDGSRDRVLCGPGRDRARVDRIDVVRGCELIRRR